MIRLLIEILDKKFRKKIGEDINMEKIHPVAPAEQIIKLVSPNSHVKTLSAC